MAKYRQIHLTFWQDPFIEDLQPLEKYFYLYLMTNSKTTQCGCYEISMKLIKYETGLTQKQINGFIKLFNDCGKIGYNKDNSEFIIINWLKHNSFKSPKVKSCIKKELESIKTIFYKDYINSILNEEYPIDSLSKQVLTPIDTGSQQEQEQEQEEKQEEEEIRKPYGINSLVLLSDCEFQNLLKPWGVDKKKYNSEIDLQRSIEVLDNYLKTNPNKKYSCHYSVMQGWVYNKYIESDSRNLHDDLFKNGEPVRKFKLKEADSSEMTEEERSKLGW